MPENIGQLASLTHLDLSRNGITALGEALFGLTRLSTLVLSRNSLAHLPPLIGQLTALTCLKARPPPNPRPLRADCVADVDDNDDVARSTETR